MTAPARHLLLVGVGPGDPRMLTLEAVDALARTDVVVVFDKGETYDDLAALRRTILAAHAPTARVVRIADPERNLPVAGGANATYGGAVRDWHSQRVALLRDALEHELPAGGVAAILVWGDPSLYDSSLRLVEGVQATLPLEVTVVAGVSSLHLLTARHRIPLNRVGAAVRLTTGRRLAEAPPSPDTDVVVFLDGRQAFASIDDEHLDIYWGAYLGSADELLIAGHLRAVKEEILRRRAEARERHGWMFDTYLLRWNP